MRIPNKRLDQSAINPPLVSLKPFRQVSRATSFKTNNKSPMLERTWGFKNGTQG